LRAHGSPAPQELDWNNGNGKADQERKEYDQDHQKSASPTPPAGRKPITIRSWAKTGAGATHLHASFGG
jgi:hypothetical protein